ncbi:hypothetical protein PQ472_12190 [Lacticaseibacillus pabuli]|uniref:Lipoprotein n=1 Tax=Lacticaseibacillus pabuli TaxID=3025672 RepID=A0ABY7WR24_9LACO|nr:hypothetical protein [Lacticaseibacillus sp. KACC 23028]WDF82635.1 hypothetical protein PQ472_12190 [Lacticaseibacillus sp. KACC 23028]
MKKTFIANTAVVVLVAGLLAACGTSSNSSKDSSSSKDTSAQSSKKADSSSESKEADSQSSSAPAKAKTYSDVASDIKQKVGAQWLPAAVSTDKAHVTATANVNAGSSTTVKFFGTDSPVNVNDAKLNGATPVYTLTKTVYANTATAVSNINWQDSDAGLPTVALGDNITATQEGAAGSQYTHWNEGKWSILVRASNVNGQNGTSLSKQLVELFRTKALPAPTDKGAVSFNVSDSQGGQTITWNAGPVVYTLTGTDAMATARTAVH